MGEVAASGGYFIAMAADAIIAQPGTITGSIGVLSGKPVLGEALQRAGVTSDAVTEGAHADMFTASRPFREDEWAKINTWLDRIYADFTGKVAAGRGLTEQQVHDVARGRVWTGADATGIGLVDSLGGLDTALERGPGQGRAAGLRAGADLPAQPPAGPAPAAASSDERQAARTSLFAEAWGPVWQLAADAGLPSYGPLLLPGRWVIQ